ncbi:peptidase domain-containing ABC transporter [Marinoscillum pacificum]|uniref:peptidase domain-containing ABC transporter n=1 Tax=Marinoscillum pacificum TaxID=392723 RepID=UPI0021573EE3|nr:peptidase domain-containing ABC transporter [Marinoscillum pacificum]
MNFKLFRQHDVMDCGPTCLRMVASFHGKNYSIQELREKSHLTKEGVSMLGISTAAESIGLRTIGVKLTFDQLQNEAPLPCIIHWNQNHFVVVYKVKNNKVWIADPVGQKIVLGKSEFLQSWITKNDTDTSKGITLLLEPKSDFYSKESDQGITHQKGLYYLFSYFRGYKKFVTQLIFGLLIGSLLQLIFPFLTQAIVDIGVNTRDLNFIYLILGGQLMLFFSRTSVDFIRRWILLHLSTRINVSIISDFLIKLMNLPLAYFDTKLIGDLLERVGDHRRVQQFLSSSSLNILFSFFNLIIFGIVLIIYNLRIFLVFTSGSVLYFLFAIIFLRKRKEIDYRRFNQQSANQTSMIQLISGMTEIKLNGAEKLKRWEWERIQAKLFKIDMDSVRLQQFQESGSLFINELKNIIITVMAATAVIKGEMTLGMMLAVQYIIGQLNGPINSVINFIREWQDARISMERIGEVHSIKNEEDEVAQRLDLPNRSGELSIENLTFRYNVLDQQNALDNISMIIPEGKITAIVGSSGSGKTTLMKLLLKIYSPTNGRLMIENINLNYVSSAKWREKVGVVMQDGFIFSDTIAKNIAISDEYPNLDKVIESCKIANIHTYIEKLPLGYSTKIGQDGTGLSQGQKQRLLIARAVYKNPQFLFFDEATSALDSNNEKIIMGNLEEFYKGKTVLVIAHRLSTVKKADQIIVLEKGKIIETGTHAELVSKKGNYYHLVKNQLELGE